MSGHVHPYPGFNAKTFETVSQEKKEATRKVLRGARMHGEYELAWKKKIIRQKTFCFNPCGRARSCERDSLLY